MICRCEKKKRKSIIAKTYCYSIHGTVLLLKKMGAAN